jgi:hypothetical protein
MQDATPTRAETERGGSGGGTDREACNAFGPLGLTGAPQACIDCIADASCSDENACDDVCPDDEE